MALSDVLLRCKAMSDLGATADIGRRYGLDGSVAFDPTRKWCVHCDTRGRCLTSSKSVPATLWRSAQRNTQIGIR